MQPDLLSKNLQNVGKPSKMLTDLPMMFCAPIFHHLCDPTCWGKMEDGPTSTAVVRQAEAFLVFTLN